MPEVPHPGEDHGDAGLSAAAITSSSRIEPPGWMTAVAPASTAASEPVGEGEERIRGDDRALGRRCGSPAALPLPRPYGGDAGAVDAAHLPGADADRGAVLGVDDGVRLHVLGDREGEQQVGSSVAARLAAW